MSRMPRQIDRYLDGLLSDDELAELMRWVAASAENADVFARHCLLDQQTHELLADGAVESAMMSDGPASRAWLWLAVAASILVGVGLLTWRGQAPSGVAYPALVAQSVGGHDDDGNAIQPGEKVNAGIFRVARGIVRLDFSNGAEVAVEGPASLEIVDALHVVLQRGIVTARIPESAHGFVVDTVSARVVDLGTAFGVSVSDQGMTDICVFEGEVEVNQRTNESLDAEPHRVFEGQAVRADSSLPTIESVDFDTGRFERAWPINSGVLQTTGLMKFVSPGPGFAPGQFEDSEHIVVIPECRDVTLESPVRIDFAEPGEYRRVGDRTTNVLAAGNRVRSYLLQLNSVGRDRTVVMGQITFDRPIQGLIASTRKLVESDAVLGHPGGVYEQNRRGIEPPRTVPPGKPDRDTVILAADKRTLVLNLGAGSALDQIRVIVDDTEPIWRGLQE
ncbi:MAG: hypothetical protein GY903_15225 [Fuerstiella sp.]|nr:hypothetical protein [Fuerstiella sp.]MCP4855834.1 hypothetical protein [Fuerstiella sp.]